MRHSGFNYAKPRFVILSLLHPGIRLTRLQSCPLPIPSYSFSASHRDKMTYFALMSRAFVTSYSLEAKPRGNTTNLCSTILFLSRLSISSAKTIQLIFHIISRRVFGGTLSTLYGSVSDLLYTSMCYSRRSD